METTGFVKLTGFMNAGKKDDIQSLFKERITRLDILFVSMAKYQEDPISQILLPEELQGILCAVKTKSDGNCLYNAAAMGIRVFHAADEDHKGFLTRHDMKTAVVELLGYKPTKYEVNQILDSFGEVIGDASENKKVLSLEKFISCMSEKLVKRDIDEEIRHTFMAFDMQCHGFLTVDDLKKVFSKVAPHIPAQAVHSAFREIDQDGDGRISYKDFEYVMKYNTADHI